MKYYSVALIVLMASFAHAQLTIEITKGSDNPYRLGIIAKSAADLEIGRAHV